MGWMANGLNYETTMTPPLTNHGPNPFLTYVSIFKQTNTKC